jgi:hypothetical protein
MSKKLKELQVCSTVYASTYLFCMIFIDIHSIALLSVFFFLFYI